MDNILIELTNVNKIYGTQIKTHALKDINLKVHKGEFTSIIGQSGSGKSTLLNIIGSLDTLTTGSYYFNGVDIGGYDKNQLASFRNQQVGFIFQFHHLLPEFTALENVLMPYSITRKPIKKDIRQRAEQYLEIVGLYDRRNYKSTNLSGGQQQRVAIARALMNNPRLVLADEPTGNLDSESTEQIYKLLREINKSTETTFLIVTHNREIAKRSDRQIEILDGKIKSITENEIPRR